MLSKELLGQLHQLSRGEKLHVMQILVNELALEETLLPPGAQYEIVTPYGNEAAAQVLFEALQAAERTDKGSAS